MNLQVEETPGLTSAGQNALHNGNVTQPSKNKLRKAAADRMKPVSHSL
jgi:hypothetical protein